MKIPIAIVLVALAMPCNGRVALAAARMSQSTVEARPSTNGDGTQVAPAITGQPRDQNVMAGEPATFAVVPAGDAPLTYQWNKNGVPINGATSSAYTIPAAALADNGAKFSVTVSGASGSVTSAYATLTVTAILPTARSSSASSQRRPERYSRFLTGSYVGIQLGYINYPFSNAQLQPGFHAQSVQLPRLGVGFLLFGHEFNRYFSAQFTETPPVTWVQYRNVNGDQATSLVRVNIGGLTGKARLPLNKKWSLFGEGGLGIVTREGFSVGGSPAIANAVDATLLLGAGVEYHLDDHWTILGEFSGTLPRADHQLPRTTFLSGGFTYTMRRVPATPGGADSEKPPLWPRNIIQFGYITDAAGFGVNDFFSKKGIPIFWSGEVLVANGLAVSYLRNMFHTRRFFALDLGADISTWKSKTQGQRFETLAVYPVLRFPLVRTNPLEFYVSYSLAGPALITLSNIDGVNTGKRFTFQDYMGAGVYLGKKRRVTAEVRIAHYSNGDLFPQDPGVTIPLGFYFGSTF